MNRVKQVIWNLEKEFGANFGLSSFPNDVFKFNPHASYESNGIVILVTMRKAGEQWLDFTKESEANYRRFMVKLPSNEKTTIVKSNLKAIYLTAEQESILIAAIEYMQPSLGFYSDSNDQLNTIKTKLYKHTTHQQRDKAHTKLFNDLTKEAK